MKLLLLWFSFEAGFLDRSQGPML